MKKAILFSFHGYKDKFGPFGINIGYHTEMKCAATKKYGHMSVHERTG